MCNRFSTSSAFGSRPEFCCFSPCPAGCSFSRPAVGMMLAVVSGIILGFSVLFVILSQRRALGLLRFRPELVPPDVTWKGPSLWILCIDGIEVRLVLQPKPCGWWSVGRPGSHQVWERPQGVRGEAWLLSALGVSAEQADLVLLLDNPHLLIGVR